ncbi:MAG: DUF2723 domain-containing protein [Cyclobacteriaceae bacterium]
MFTEKDYLWFIAAGFMIAAAYILMAIDPVENGFGINTLWIAPPILLAGFLFPVLGITGVNTLSNSFIGWKNNKMKHIFGGLTFLIAFISYLMTLEPTASLWDCSEFIASAYKLQVPHTPGTPLSLLIGRLFIMISFGDIFKVAWSLNLMSGFFSALTISLVYYIIFYLGENMIGRTDRHQNLILVLSSFGGGLCLAFSDTFWFSAVEAETYGPACFFLLLIVWLILTGKDLEEPLRSRRLVLIFYLAGLAYCVHPMCLLAIPLLPFAWATVKRKLTFQNTILSISAGFAIVLIINRFVAVSLFELAFSFDLFFVNQLHFPFYSGPVILTILLVFFFWTIIRKYAIVTRYAWAIIFLLLGFLPYVMLFIRSNHNPPIDETNPENLAMIKAYMNRESYPSSPLLYGPYFDAKIRDISAKKEIFYKSGKTYDVAGTLPEYHYDSKQTILPRIYSNDEDHVSTYRSWTGLKPNEKPAFSDNLRFMFTYQLGHMYLRYFMWNFAGRLSDEQHSTWLKPWQRLGNSHFESARNQYWMIPLLLGMIGAIFQYGHDRNGFICVAIFFLITGLVLALYLNSTPNEPRERDYIYVGSYIAFCIWIGLGILSIGKYASKIQSGIIIPVLIAIFMPLWMLYQNYDDHDRSGRTFQVDNARNVLKSCAPNSILFTGGDNDTFPLWYVQEVEGFRTDVRVMVLSYMNTDWYINQLRKSYYDSGAFDLALNEKDYRQYGANDVLYVQESIKSGIDFRQYLQLLKNEHPALTMFTRNGEPYHILPSRTLRLGAYEELSSNNSNVFSSRDTANEIILQITGDYVSKNVLAILDLIVSNEWKRPIHFNYTSMNTLGVDLSQYVVQEGAVFRLKPDKNPDENIPVNTALSYENLIVKADYSNLKDSSIHLSYEDHHARMLVPIRQSFNELAMAFLDEGNIDMAEKVLVEATKKLYHKHLRPSYTNVQAAEILLSINRNQLADSLTKAAFDYYYDLVKSDIGADEKPGDLDVYLLRRSAELLAKSGHNQYQQRLADLGISIKM